MAVVRIPLGSCFGPLVAFNSGLQKSEAEVIAGSCCIESNQACRQGESLEVVSSRKLEAQEF